MFVEKLKQIEVERQFLPALCQTTSFGLIDGDAIYFAFKNLISNKTATIILHDFTIDNHGNNMDYLKFMYSIFGNEYKDELIKYFEKMMTDR